MEKQTQSAPPKSAPAAGNTPTTPTLPQRNAPQPAESDPAAPHAQTAPHAQSVPHPAESDPAPTHAQTAPPKRTALRTIEDYDRLYTAKTGDTPRLPRGFTLAYLPERGWCQWQLDTEGKLFLIWAVSGDGHFWRDWARATAAALGCRAIVTICTRPIRAYIRFWHWHIDRTETKEDKHRFHCHTADGRRVIITHKHTDPDGQDAYWVTEYLTERNDTHG